MFGRKSMNAVHLDGTRTIHLAGAQHYVNGLQRVVKRNREERARVEFAATLVPERNNPHDPNAVAVFAEGRTIGHLSRDDAAAYRQSLERLTTGGSIVTATGYIYAGHHGGSRWSVGVRMPRPANMP